MAHGKLLNNMLAEPAKFFRMPWDVLRDRRLNKTDRTAILEAWKKNPGESLDQIEAAAAEVACQP